MLEVHFRGEEESKKGVLRSIKTGGKFIQPKNHIYFKTIEGFRNFMTAQKLELLTVIFCSKPKISSIYELAKLVRRDFSTVQKDCKSLALVGFIRFSPKKTGKRLSMVPEPSFNYSAIAVFLPEVPASYKIEFRQAA